MNKQSHEVGIPAGRDKELELLYQLGITLASGKDLFTTLLALQTEILKLIEADALFVAIYDEETDIVQYPIYFEVGVPEKHPSRRLSDRPGLTGNVIYGRKTVYLPDKMMDEIVNTYSIVTNDNDQILHTFLGIPLVVSERIIGVLSVQSRNMDAYTSDQIHFMENVAIQAALVIDKSRLLDQLKQELQDRKKMEIDLRQRDTILEAVAFSAKQFLNTPDWRLNIISVLEILGKTLSATHAYLFEIHPGVNGERLSSLRFEWTAPGFDSDLDNPAFQNDPLFQEGFERYYAALRSGESFIGSTSSFLPAEREHFSSLGIKAMVEVPLFVNGDWWGTIGFDDVEQEREWSGPEVDALQIAASVLSAAIQRQKADSAVQESERIYRQAIEAADAVPYYQDYKSNSYLFIGEGIRAMTGYRPEEMHPKIWFDIVEETVMLGAASGLSSLDALHAVRSGRIKAWKCDQKIRTRDGQIRWLTDRSVELLDDRNVSYASIGILQDITDRKLTEAGLRKRESILEAITFSAEQFLKTSNWRENINIVLERLGTEFDVSHAYLFEHHHDLSGQPTSSMSYEWTASGFVSDLDDPLFKNNHFIQADENSSDKTLKRGEAFVGNTFSFPDIEREHLQKIGIKALIEIPLIVQGEWWGTIGFDDMVHERDWNATEVDALKIAAGILSAAVQRQEAESAVQESERMYRRAIEAAGAVPYYQDYESNNYTFMGQGIKELTGYMPGEMNPALWNRMVQESELSGDLAGLTEDEAIRLVREGKAKAWRCDYRILAQDGQTRWISDSAVGLFGDGGYSYASIGIMQDITERKLVEANLRQREEMLQALTFSAQQFLKAPDWRESINVVLERLGKEFNATHAYLFEKHEGPGGKILTSMRYEWTAPGFHSDLDDPEFQNIEPSGMGFERFYTILDHGEPLVGDITFFNEFEKEYVSSIGVKALLEIRVSVNGKQWGTLGFDDIVTERIWTPAEVDVLRVAAGLLGAAIKRQVDETTLQNELSQRKMLIDELEAKNEELERFTYTVSHDLKSPLVTINGFVGYLEQDAVNGNIERLKQDVRRIQDAVNKMQRLLNELLELSRVGRMINLPSAVRFSELVHEAMEILHGRIETNSISVHVDPDLPTVNGDKPRLVEVLQNLIDNAAKYMGNQPNPSIEIGQRGEENGKPVFYIKDNGIGIAPEHFERIFGLFNKLDVKSEGTGVGLALVKRIIEVHGCRIWVESNEGKGSTFLFTLSASGQADA